LSLLFESRFLSKEKNKVVLIGTIISVVSYSLGMLILGPIYGIIGFASALIISTSLKTGFYSIMLKFVKKENS